MHLTISREIGSESYRFLQSQLTISREITDFSSHCQILKLEVVKKSLQPPDPGRSGSLLLSSGETAADVQHCRPFVKCAQTGRDAELRLFR